MTDWRTWLIIGLLVVLVVGPAVAFVLVCGGAFGFWIGRQHERELQEYRAWLSERGDGA